MKKFVYFLLLFLSTTPHIIAEAYFIRLKETGFQARIHQLAQNYQTTNANKTPAVSVKLRQISATLQFEKWYTIEAEENDLASLLTKIEAENLVDFVEPVGKFRIDHIIDDSLSAQQWYLNKIQAPQAWEKTMGDPAVIIGVIDTGVDYMHPDLQGVFWKNNGEVNGLPGVDDDGNGFVDDSLGWDFTDAPRFADSGDYLDEDNDPMDEYGNGHGTQIAGIIAARNNNITGISGIAPGVRVMILRAGTASGFLEEDDVARAILYAVENGADILNMSFGDLALSRLLQDVIHFAYNQGMIMVASAGNSGSDVLNYPAALQEIISVGASTIDDNLAGFSSYGSTVDLVAPGDSILSTARGGGYNLVNGTSFSAPMVAAASGLILSRQSEFSVEKVRNILKTSADDVLFYGWDIYSGAGRLNADKAVNVEQGGLLEIISPRVNQNTSDEIVWITGSAVHPDILFVALEYGIGKNPEQWITINTFNKRQVFQDTLGNIALSSIADTVLNLKLSLTTVDGLEDEMHRLVTIDRTPPQIANISAVPMFDGADRSCLISFQSDDVCRAKIILHSCDDPESSLEIDFPFESASQILKLPAAEFDGCYKFKVEATNLSNLTTVDSASGNYYEFDLDFDYDWTNFISVPWKLPGGHFLDKPIDLNQNDVPEILLSEYGPEYGYGPVALYEFSNGNFIKQFETLFPAIPRDAGDVDRDGKSDMLLGYGQNSFVYESVNPGGFPADLIWADTTNFWCAAFADLNDNGHGEIIGRQDSLYLVFENEGDNIFAEVARLPNHSEGENSYGTPIVRTSDFNADGFQDIVFGDHDGDVMIYSFASSEVEQLATIRATQKDATGLLDAHMQDLFVATHTEDVASYEHEIDSRYWSIDHFKYDVAADSFVQKTTIHVSGYKNLKEHDSGIRIGEIDGERYLFAALFPNLYVFRIEDEELPLVWFNDNTRSNSVIIADFDNNGSEEFYVNTGDSIAGFAGIEISKPPYPLSFMATPLDSNRIQLQWSEMSGSETYQLSRGVQPDSLSELTIVYGTQYTDSLLAPEQSYYYCLSAIDSSYVIPESNRTDVIMARTSYPPKLTSVKVINDHQMELTFNETITFLDQRKVNVSTLLQNQSASSVIILPAKNALLCSFSSTFLDGVMDTVIVKNIFDDFGVAVDQRFNHGYYIYNVSESEPYLLEAELVSKQIVVLYFSRAMEQESVLDVNNYTLIPSGQVLQATAMDSLVSVVELKLSPDSYSGSTGRASYLQLDNLTDINGIVLNETSRINLFSETFDLDNIVVYPQPLKPDHQMLTFAGLPASVEISVFNINGKRVWNRDETTYFGGIQWNLEDYNGNRVPGGVYLYEIVNDGQRKIGKILIVR